MSETDDTAQNGTNTADENRAPGKDLMGPKGIALIIGYLVSVIAIIMVVLVVLWPPLKPDQQLGSATPSPTATPTPAPTPTPTPTPSPTPRRTAPGAGANQPPDTTAPANRVVPAVTPCPSPSAAATPDYRNGIKGGYCMDEDAKPRKGVSPFRFFGTPRCMFDEDRLLIIVLLAGAFGSLIHGLRSFVWYVGNRKAVWSWSAYYFALPFIGSGLAFMFYLVVRGGFAPNTSVDATSPVGFAAVAALIGMFTEQAVQKLKGVSETILAPAEKGKDHIDGPTITSISPPQGSVAGGEEVTITGENFSTPVTVKFGGATATVNPESNSRSIKVTAPPAPDGKAQKVDVVIINTGGAQPVTQRDGYEYQDPGTPVGQGNGPIAGPTISSISPPQGPVTGGDQVTITGENFSTPVTVKFGTATATVKPESNSSSIEVTAPPAPDLKAQKVDVVIINTDAQTVTERDGYEYTDAGTLPPPASPTDSGDKPVDGEDGDEDGVDGCDVQLKTDTPDEALPITEGGVE